MYILATSRATILAPDIRARTRISGAVNRDRARARERVKRSFARVHGESKKKEATADRARADVQDVNGE